MSTTATLTRDEAPVKVLVQSSWKETRAITRREYVADGKGGVTLMTYERQFVNYRCYMTMEEAKFLVESKENKACQAAGEMRYFYPAGFPYPAPWEFEVEKYGVFTGPIQSGTVSTGSSEAAEGQRIHDAERAEALERVQRENATTSAKANVAAQREAEKS